MSDVASYLESMGARPSAGSNWVMKCPFCDRNNHLYCTVEDSEDWDGKKKPAGVWICFGCGEKSREFAVLMAELEGITFQEARATIGKWKLGGIKLRPPSAVVPKKVTTADSVWLPAEYEPVGAADAVWPKYLTRRGISRETALAFKLGVCRRHDRCEHCKPRGGCPKNMAHRIILPIECPAGKSYQARAIDPMMQPRYLSGDNSGQLLFGWHTVAESDFAVIVEGPFDAIQVYQAKLPAVALMGKEIRDPQVLMLRMRRRQYVVALDPLSKDKYAIDSACKIAELLGGKVVVGLDTDPGDATVDQIVKAVDGAVEPLEARQMALEVRLSALASRRR